MGVKLDGADAALAALTGGATSHLALSATASADATEAASGEIAGGGYARQPVAAWTKTTEANGDRKWANAAPLAWDFTGPVAGNATVVSAQIWSALAGGDLLLTVDLVVPVPGIVNGSRVSFAAGAFAVTMPS